ncbi:DNA polymerase III subunit beta [Candidatus Daviesbacteria bacterium]|nr:DNA polymerase III subunit beta [Candidatus Daviesbacteria bacterium]
MKITILQQDLVGPLQAVSRSTGKSNLPVLANILIQTEAGKLKLSATNLEIGVIKKVNAKVEEDGEITVPSRTFLDVITSLTGEKITLEGSLDQLKISTSSFKASINGIPANEFPSIPLASEQSVVLDAFILKQSLPEITFAAAVDEGRPILTGILTEIKKDSLELVATDGFRLAHKKVKILGEGEFKALIPRKTFEEIVRLIDEDLVNSKEEKVEMATAEGQNQIIFKIGQTELSSRLIEGNFPSWDKIIPKEFENRTIIEKGELAKAVKLASVFAKDVANIIKIQTSENKIIVSSETKELGSQESEVECLVEGSPLIIAFNGRFLSDVLAACSTSQIAIEFSGSLSAALLKPVGEEGLEYIIMPVRLT